MRGEDAALVAVWSKAISAGGACPPSTPQLAAPPSPAPSSCSICVSQSITIVPPCPSSALPRRTPLVAGLISNVFHLAADVVLVFVMGWGVAGAALATSLSHWLTLVILLGLVLQRGYLRCGGGAWVLVLVEVCGGRA